MKISQKTVGKLVPILDIQVQRDTRQRRELEVLDLEKSIQTFGLINPILVEALPDKTFRLVAGERRLTACRNLGWLMIPVRLANNLSQIEQQLLELEENVKRKDLSWQEIVQTSGKIHQLHLEIDPEWSKTETAEVMDISLATLSTHLRVFTELVDSKIAKASTLTEAYNTLVRRDQRRQGQELEDLLATDITPTTRPQAPAPAPNPSMSTGPEQPTLALESPAPSPAPGKVLAPAPAGILSPAKSILHESFLQWAPRYSGPKFNLLHCDFPYGIDLFAGPQGGGDRHISSYDDSKDVYWALLNCLADNLDNLLSLSAHVVFWFSEKHGEATRKFFSDRLASLILQPFPLIWLKSCNSGIASDPTRGPRHVYETALLASRGDRKIVRIVGDAYAAPSDRTQHVSCKPEPMLKHFFTMLVDENTRLLDPTCGSASSLRAAEALGASQVLGLEIDETNCELARQSLRQSRNIRAISKRKEQAGGN